MQQTYNNRAWSVDRQSNAVSMGGWKLAAFVNKELFGSGLSMPLHKTRAWSIALFVLFRIKIPLLQSRLLTSHRRRIKSTFLCIDTVEKDVSPRR